MPSADIFTFITVYYKHGAYDSVEFETLREGLQDFLESYIGGRSHEAGIHRQQLEALPDEELLTEILKIGSERIRDQVGQGLVAVVEGPRFQSKSDSCVYLELYYKHGSWNVSQGWSEYIEEALEELEKEGILEDWDEMSEEDKNDWALERCQENVKNQRGWGAVLMVPGRLVAKASM